MTSPDKLDPTFPKHYNRSSPLGSDFDDFPDVSTRSIDNHSRKDLPPVPASPRATDDVQAECSKAAR